MSRFLPTPPAFDAPVRGGVPVGILPWRLVKTIEKNEDMFPFDRMYERDRQTDGHTPHKRACLASCGKNRLGLGYLCVLNQLLLFSCTTLREINHFEWKFNTDNRPITEEMLIWRIYASFAFGHSSLQTVGLYLNGWWVHYTHAAAEASLTTEWIQNKLGTIWKTSGSESRLMQKFWLKARITFAGRGKG